MAELPPENHISLSDGRRLAYTEFGAPAGLPVFYFHGAPSSRLEPLLIGDDALKQSGFRFIAPDRPGIGGSDPKPGRRIFDWPADVLALADALGLKRFGVLGNSGGGPYAVACAAMIPSRIAAAVVISGGWRMDWPEARDHLPFVNRLVMTLARRAPFLLGLLFKMMGSVAQGDRDKELQQMKGRMPAPDYEAFAVPGRLEAFGAAMRETMRQGTCGAVWEMGLYVRDFGFDPAAVRIPVTWLHGEADANAPIQLARRAAASIPTARLAAYPGEAHLSTLCNHFTDAAEALRTTWTE